MTRMIDLHVHTTASDGTFTPSEVVSLAKKAGIAAVAITDHDTIDGVEEAINKAKGENLELVPGVEISVGDTEDIHIVGLYINYKDENLLRVMDILKGYRKIRNEELIANVRKEGFDITYESIAKTMNTNNVGRLHIAYYMQKMGMVNDYRKVFKKYLIPGTKTYVPMKQLSEEAGIGAILNSGGIPVLAHINYLKQDEYGTEDTVKRLIGYGLKGIEVMYSGYDKNTEELALKISEKYNLIKSGGTDFHGTRRTGVYLGTGRGNMCVPYEFLLDIKKKL
ncbi:MAG: PHP domain-containing protein [Clostridia bacterium]|nr:PHP domain-containing protein [Clostridia bacterium]